jgi:cell fate regulator YaaT (PSP1 superfamily)
VQEDSAEIKKVLRKSNDLDIQKWKESKAREKEALIRSRAIARQLNLNMKLCEVDIQADGRKATFFYIADDRVDFRELIKVYAGEFRVKVEMKQIGARQESAKVGGIGSCGRELCCSSWLSDFKSVTTNIARYQNLSINQTKLSGQCGRLKCCLNYELDTYLDALQHFPTHADMLETEKGNAILVKKDIFKNLMWYVLPDSNRQYPLDIETVRTIKAMNLKGIKATAVEFVESVQVTKAKEPETQFVELVGQISLRSLEKNAQKKRQKDQRSRDSGSSSGRPQGRAEGNRGDQRPTRGEGGGRNEGRLQGRDPQRGQNPPRQDRTRGDQKQGEQRRGDQRTGNQRQGDQKSGNQRRSGGEGGGNNEGRQQAPRQDQPRNQNRGGQRPRPERPGGGSEGNPNPSNPGSQAPAPE